jgi:preprotein translocase subunit Sec61beta
LLKFLDILLTAAHLALIGFNLFGWIWPKTRKAHLITVAATAFSWFVLGVWFGWGYCPITDWQWKVKEKLGETGLPNSFIKYYVDKISGKDIDPKIVDMATLIVFLVVIILTLLLNFFNTRRKRSSKTL